jgi:hypothetical protein
MNTQTNTEPIRIFCFIQQHPKNPQKPWYTGVAMAEDGTVVVVEHGSSEAAIKDYLGCTIGSIGNRHNYKAFYSDYALIWVDNIAENKDLINAISLNHHKYTKTPYYILKWRPSIFKPLKYKHKPEVLDE